MSDQDIRYNSDTPVEKPAPLNKPSGQRIGGDNSLHGEQIHRAHIVSVRAETISGAVTYYLETEGKGPLQISARFQRKAFDSLPDAVKALVPPADMKVDFDVAWKWVEITKRGGGQGKVREVLNVYVPDTTGMDRASIRSRLLGERGINPGSKTQQVHGYLDSHVTPDTDLEEYARFVNDAIDEVKGKPERKYSPAKWERWIRGTMADKCRAKSIVNKANIDDLIGGVLETAKADDRLDDDQFILNLLNEEIIAFNDMAAQVAAQRKGTMQAPATTIDAPALAPDAKPAAFEIDVETWKRIDKLCVRYKVAAAGREERITGWLGKDWNGSPDDTYRKIYLAAIDEYAILQRKPFLDDVVQMFRAAGFEVSTREAIKRVNIEAALDIEPRMLPSEVVTGVSAWIKAQQKMAEDVRAEEAAKAKEQSAPKAPQKAPDAPPAITEPVTPTTPASAPVVSVESGIVEPTAEKPKGSRPTLVKPDPSPLLKEIKTLMGIPVGELYRWLNLKHDRRYYKEIQPKDKRKDENGKPIMWTDLDPVAVRKRFDKVFGPQGLGWRILPLENGRSDWQSGIQKTSKGDRDVVLATSTLFVFEYTLVVGGQMQWFRTSAFSDSSMNDDAGDALRGVSTSLMKQALRLFGGFDHFVDKAPDETAVA